MDGIYFYWISWLFWIVVTFFMPRIKTRTIFAIWILVTISVSKLYISINQLEISFSYLSILLGGFILLSTLNRKYLLVLSAITIMIGYSSLLIWEGNGPVWLFLPRLLIIPILTVWLTLFISKGMLDRLTICLIGVGGGEFLYCLLLANYSIYHPIGTLHFLDTIFVMFSIILVIEVVQRGREKLILLFGR